MFQDILECSGMLTAFLVLYIEGLTTVAKTSLKKLTYCCFKICRSYSSMSFNFSNVGDFFGVEF